MFSLVEGSEPLVCVEEGGGARVEELGQLLHQGQHSLTTQLVACTHATTSGGFDFNKQEGRTPTMRNTE